MRALSMILLAATALTIGVAGSALAKASFSAVQASGSEYRINLSRGKIKPGKLRLEFVNFGEDDHDLVVQRKGQSFTRNLGVTRPGERAVDRFNVRKGTYQLWCSISDHRARGMSATLKVR